MDFEEISVPVPWIEMAHDLGQVRYGSSLRRVRVRVGLFPSSSVQTHLFGYISLSRAVRGHILTHMGWLRRVGSQ